MFFRNQIEEEKKSVSQIIQLYCRKVHGQTELCKDCNLLKAYALKRLDNCQFGGNKPVCAKCQIHCYSPQMRKKIRQVMRYAGPRMLFIHPWQAILHIYRKIR